MVRKSTNWVVQRRPELGVSFRLRGVVQLMLTATAMLIGQQKGATGSLRAGILVHIGSYPAVDGSGQEDGMGVTATCLPLRSEARCRLGGPDPIRLPRRPFGASFRVGDIPAELRLG
jgi:hypothetical protein